jgi:purine-nucleoside phosphorylase
MNTRLDQLSSCWRDRVAEAVSWLQDRGFTGRAGVILGSGLGNFVDAVEQDVAADYDQIPGFRKTTVSMHTGRLVCGRAAGVPVLVMQGRLHPYEGFSADDLLLPVAVLACLGIDSAVVTNAAGGLNRHYQPGDLMAIRDHVDLHLHDPLRGLLARPMRPARELDAGQEQPAALARIGRRGGPAHLYDPRLARLLVKAAAATGIPMHSGTYASMYGPAFETKAEIGMLRRMGCDAVGMSTAPEAVLLKHLGVEPVGLSCITNPSRETGQPELSHHDVVEVGRQVRQRMADLILEFLPRLPV